MTPTDLRRIGEALFGREWQTPLAAALGVPTRTLRRWLDGSRTIPSRIPAELLALLPARMSEARERVQALRQVERELRRAA